MGFIMNHIKKVLNNHIGALPSNHPPFCFECNKDYCKSICIIYETWKINPEEGKALFLEDKYSTFNP